MASKDKDNASMSAMAIEERKTREWVLKLQDREQERTGNKKPCARRAVAKNIGVAPGTLENIERRRNKGLSTKVFEKIRAAFLREAENELRWWENEKQIALQIGLDRRCEQVREIEAHIEALREAMK